MAEVNGALYPTFRYSDAPRAIAWLQEAFGFRELQVIANEDGTIAHAELALGQSVLMLGSDRDDPLFGRRAGSNWIYAAVEDPDAHCERARAAGAEIVAEPYDTDYGSRDYTARDLERNVWHFGSYQPDVTAAPEGASAANA